MPDYTTYHAVLCIEAGMVALMLIVLSVYCWRRLKNTHTAGSRTWTFEQPTYFCFGLASTVAAVFMLLLVAANLSSVLNPHEGFVHSIPDLGTPHAGTHTAALHQAVTTWAQSGSAHMPALLHDEVSNRLSWQRRKAISCSILLVVCAVFTVRVWQTVLRNRRASEAMWSMKEKARITVGVLAVPGTLLLMILALATTQAAFASVTLTLLFG